MTKLTAHPSRRRDASPPARRSGTGVPASTTWRSSEGSALVSVLVIIAVVSTLIAVVLSLASLRHQFIQRDLFRSQARYAAEAVVYQELAALDGSLRAVEKSRALEIGETVTARCSIAIQPHGGFAEVEAVATVRGESHRVWALAGMAPPPELDNALTFAGERSAITLTGNSHITGPVATGARGLETSSLRGQRFTGSVDGTVDREPGRRLPDFDDQALQDALDDGEAELRAPPPGASGAWENPSSAPLVRGRRTFFVNGDVVLGASDQSTFFAPSTILATGAITVQDGLHLPPGTRLIAGRSVQLAGAVTGKGILVIGPDGIFIGSDAKLSAQLLSREQIFIAGGAQFTYPSLAYVQSPRGTFQLAEDAQIHGWVLFPNRTDRDTRRESEVKMKAGALVRGAVYAQATAEMEGTVFGSVLARRFSFYESPTQYVNWIRDLKIDRTRRPAEFASPFGFDASPRPSIIEWTSGPSNARSQRQNQIVGTRS